MAGEFTKPNNIVPAVLGQIANPDDYNQNIAGQSTDAIVGIDEDGSFADVDLGDETLITNGALIKDIKIREGYSFRVFNSSGVEISTVEFNDILSPIGAVMAFAMNSSPTGWLECDGSAISRTTYNKLFLKIGTTFGVGDGSTTFNIPDLRGYFVRGWANGGSIDSGRVFGSAQLDAFQGHWHKIGYDGTATGSGARFSTAGAGRTWAELNTANPPPGLATEGVPLRSQNSTTDGTNGTPRTAAETRPVNVALMYCIKY